MLTNVLTFVWLLGMIGSPLWAGLLMMLCLRMIGPKWWRKT